MDFDPCTLFKKSFLTLRLENTFFYYLLKALYIFFHI